MFITLRNCFFKIFLLVACVVLLVLHLAQPINLTTADIGRHIKNGELLSQGQHQILYKNFYSFTYPDYPFINHHWLFGFISFFLLKFIGFEGLSVFYILLLGGAFLLAFDSARRYGNFNIGLLAAIAGLLLCTSRTEIRPEGVSVLFVALDFWLLQRYLLGKINPKLCLTLIVIIQLIWVNTHIFFPIGLVLIGVFFWQAQLNGLDKKKLFYLKALFVMALLINVFNPSGLAGMLTPLNGFKKFGYSLAENQSIFFMIQRFPDTFLFKYFLVVAVIFMMGMVLTLWREGIKGLPMVVLGGLTLSAAIGAVRLIMPFGFIFLPLMVYYYQPYITKSFLNKIILLLAMSGMAFIAFMPIQSKIGLMPGVNESADFFKREHLKGPIFSNYDIGGYLIYHLAGQEKVYVDNRQEAFPYDFLQKEYIPIQEDEEKWQKALLAYKFNVIYFDRLDLTPWGQSFLIKRVNDNTWAPIFVDNYVIIFVRRTLNNQDIIAQFELPKSIFSVKPG